MSETLNEYDDLLDGEEHRWRNRLIGLAVLAALVVAGAYALWTMFLSGGGSSSEEIQTATVERGTITNSVSTTGVVAAQSTTNLSFEESGRITAVSVTLGQEVKKGDVLAEIEPDTLEEALVKAEANLTSAQIKLDQLLEGADTEEVASAEQSVVQAQANYDEAYRAFQDLYEPPSDSERLSAEQSVSSAQSNLAKAQESRANLDSASEDTIAAAEEAVSKAEDAVEDAEDAVNDAEDDVDSAEEDLAAAEEDLEDAESGGSAEEIAAAEEAVSKAEDALEAAEDALEKAEDAVDSAEEDLAAAEEDLEDARSGPSDVEIASADAAVVSAQQGLDLAIEKLAELYEEPTEDELAHPQSNLDSAALGLTVAQAKRADVYDGTDWEDIVLQSDQVELAEIAVERAGEDLEKAQLIAPFDGTVAELNIEVGEVVGGAGGSGGTAIVLNTPNAVRLELTISESDLTDVKVGQSGTATFDAIEDRLFPIVIESIGTNPTTTQGVVIYQVRASIQTGLPQGAGGALPTGRRAGVAGQADAPAAATTPTPGAGETPGGETPSATPVPGTTPSAGEGGLPGGTGELPADIDTEAKPVPGMNASVTIIVDQAQDVLTLPEYAIQSEGRDSVVEVLKEDGTTETVVVETGISDGTNTEIVSGLEEGQTIILPTGTAAAAETTPAAGFPQFQEFQEGGPPGEGGPIIIGGGEP